MTYECKGSLVMNKKIFPFRRLCSILLNLFMFLAALISIVYIVTFRAQGNMDISGTYALMFFTVDSNILGGVACLLTALALLFSGRLPYGILMFKYVSTTAVAVTLSTVALFLGPVMRYKGLFVGTNLFLHLICPAAAIISLIFFDGGERIGRKRVWLGTLPTVAYGIVYFFKVVVIGYENGGWMDFYGFNRGGHWYISFVFMIAGTALLGWILQAVHDRVFK